MGFGSLEDTCAKTPLPICLLIGPTSPLTGTHMIQASCYSRSVGLANTVIFEGAAGVAHILALIMTITMILHVRSKFTAVGRKEITVFFYSYVLLTMASLVVDCGVVPPGSSSYPYFVAVQCGLASATCISLMIAGFVGFQLYEDGTTLSVWLLRLCSVAMFVISFAVSILTFKGFAGLEPENTVGLFVVVYLFSALFLTVYVVMQLILVIGTLQDRWPLLHIFFGVLCFVLGQVTLYVLSETICVTAQHFIDGLFIGTLFNLFAVMMVYKYWDTITKEDLEFSVGQKQHNWEVKDVVPEDSKQPVDDGDYSNMTFQQPIHHGGSFGG
ncbi:chitin synthase III catalytic subunit [Neohortaea acidophila]|uniref:Chitin synthase export chaperone n=1 Tax=Neohortaea acidophila TaxID=245834 RepID=A0A6A6Q310_9PEZI|nr:chitin synthase III catalytic subunit [Neohortaea acidophila]KAF2486384.1 chitin synthase III catalytic subunit [Neohortaea acidophila]